MLDVGALDAVESRLEQQEVLRSAAHAGLLRDVLELHRLHTAGGCGLATIAQVALLTRSSEFRAGALLADAQLLADLPGAPEALDCGLLTVEQARLVCSQLGASNDLPAPDNLASEPEERAVPRPGTGAAGVAAVAGPARAARRAVAAAADNRGEARIGSSREKGARRLVSVRRIEVRLRLDHGPFGLSPA